MYGYRPGKQRSRSTATQSSPSNYSMHSQAPCPGTHEYPYMEGMKGACTWSIVAASSRMHPNIYPMPRQGVATGSMISPDPHLGSEPLVARLHTQACLPTRVCLHKQECFHAALIGLCRTVQHNKITGLMFTAWFLDIIGLIREKVILNNYSLHIHCIMYICQKTKVTELTALRATNV